MIRLLPGRIVFGMTIIFILLITISHAFAGETLKIKSVNIISIETQPCSVGYSLGVLSKGNILEPEGDDLEPGITIVCSFRLRDTWVVIKTYVGSEIIKKGKGEYEIRNNLDLSEQSTVCKGKLRIGFQIEDRNGNKTNVFNKYVNFKQTLKKEDNEE